MGSISLSTKRHTSSLHARLYQCCAVSLASQTDTSLIDSDSQSIARLGDIQANNKFTLLF
jgi:hypothetical protein